MVIFEKFSKVLANLVDFTLHIAFSLPIKSVTTRSITLAAP